MIFGSFGGFDVGGANFQQSGGLLPPSNLAGVSSEFVWSESAFQKAAFHQGPNGADDGNEVDQGHPAGFTTVMPPLGGGGEAKPNGDDYEDENKDPCENIRDHVFLH